MSYKAAIKCILSYIYNPLSMFRIKEIYWGSSIDRGLLVQNPHNIAIGKDVHIGRMARLSCYGDGEIKIEEGCYICHFFSAITSDELVIKKNTLIASYVTIIGENHGMNPELGLLYGHQPLIGKPVIIGGNCWIGEKVLILPGVTIGDWCIIGAGSVVNKSIPSYSIAVGNPAKVVKKYNFANHAWEKV